MGIKTHLAKQDKTGTEWKILQVKKIILTFAAPIEKLGETINQ